MRSKCTRSAGSAPAGCSGAPRSGLVPSWTHAQNVAWRHPERVTETTVDQLAEAVLRLLGVPAPEAARLGALPLPPPTRGNGWVGTPRCERGRRQVASPSGRASGCRTVPDLVDIVAS